LHANLVAQGAQCLAFGALCIVVGQFLLTFADPRRGDPFAIRKASLIRRDQVPGWLYRFLTFSGQTEDSIGAVRRVNVAQGILSAGLGIALAIYGVFELVRGFI